MNFATLKGLTIPEGKVTKITDASGRVLWSAVVAPPFTAIVHLGTLTTINMGSVHVGTTKLTAMPEGWDTCTHAMVNGILYEVTVTSAQNGVQYIPADTSVFSSILVCDPPNVTTGYFKASGTYTVQLGVLA